MVSVAQTVARTRNEEPKTWQNSPRVLQIVFTNGQFAPGAIFEFLYYAPNPDQPVPPDWGYRASVTRLWNRSEDAEVLEARRIVETAIQQSSCPAFEKSVHYQERQSLAH